MIHFLDSSAFAKRYVREVGSDVVARFFRRPSTVAVSSLAGVEVPAALFKRARAGDLSLEAARTQASRVARDMHELNVVEARTAVLELAAELVSKRPLRAYDAVQLASALRLHRAARVAVTLVSADTALNTVAMAEGLRATFVG